MFRNLSLLLLSLIVLTFPAIVSAADALQVLPTRVVMDKQKSAEVTLVNKGTDAGTYRILLRNIRTDDDGKFIPVETPNADELFADKMIRFSPRRVTVEPGNFQKIRVMLKKSKGLPDGEYRTHMVFQSLPQVSGSDLEEVEGEELAVSVDPVIEISIPIIVRVGKLDINLEIDSPAVIEDVVTFDIKRQGTRSTYGDIEVLINSGNKKGQRVSFAKGMSVYYPNNIRHIRLPISVPDGVGASDQLLIKYTEDTKFGGSLVVEKSFKMQ